MKKLLPILLLCLCLASACSSPPVAGPTPTAAPPATPAATATVQPTAVATPTATAAPSLEPTPPPARDLPAPGLFDTAWDDRTPFAPGLIGAEQDALDALPGASVYHIDLTISDDLSHLDGRQEVLYTNTEAVPLDEIDFRLFPNVAAGRSAVLDLTVNGAAVTPRLTLADSALIVPLAPALQPGEQVVVAMRFSVEVPTQPGGNYGTFALLDDILALAHFYPMIAVYDDEGWNVEIAPQWGDVVYADSSFYLVRVSAPRAQNIVATGVGVGSAEEGDRQIVTFAAGPVRDFYIVSSARFEKLSETVGETTIHTYAPPEYASENELVRQYAVASFRSYSERFGAYPFTELDVAGTPTLAGGVEYPGIVVVALAIYDAENPFFEGAATHEVAHQWFYSTVGNDQIDEPWLDESLTQYATMLYYGDEYGSEGYEGFRRSLEGRWQRVDNADIPIGLPVSAYEGASYGAIIYGRGPLFFEALAAEMGAPEFAAFLRDYYETFKYGIATTGSFKALAEQDCGCNLTPLFDTWVYP